ncbi:MAG: VanZ family protein [Halobacteriota archaeon]|nr:VanZ family protein [Halobacteriota archaeon]
MEEKRSNLFYLYLSLTCAYALMIFTLSSRSVVSQPFDIMDIEFVNELVHILEHNGIEFVLYPFFFVYLFFDKFAHMVLYAGLGALMYLTLSKSRIKSNIPFIVVIIGTFYGITDEIHQYFVIGRTASVYDLVADIIGIIIALAFFHFYKQALAPINDLCQ